MGDSISSLLPTNWKDLMTASAETARDKAVEKAQQLATKAKSLTTVSSTICGNKDATYGNLDSLSGLIGKNKLHLGQLESNLTPVVTTTDNGEPEDYCTVVQSGDSLAGAPMGAAIQVWNTAERAYVNVTITYDQGGQQLHQSFEEGMSMSNYGNISQIDISYNGYTPMLNTIVGQDILGVVQSLNAAPNFLSAGLKAAAVEVGVNATTGRKLYNLAISATDNGAGNPAVGGGRGNGIITVSLSSYGGHVPAPAGGGNIFDVTNEPAPGGAAPNTRYDQGIVGKDATINVDGIQWVNEKGGNDFKLGPLTITAKKPNTGGHWQNMSMEPNTDQAQSEVTEIINQLNNAFLILAQQQETEKGDDGFIRPVEGAVLVHDLATDEFKRSLADAARRIMGANVGVELKEVAEDSEGPKRYKLVIKDSDLFDKSMHDTPEKLRNVLFNYAVATPIAGTTSTLTYTNLMRGLSADIEGKKLPIRVTPGAGGAPGQVDVDFGDGAGFINVGTLNGTSITFTDARFGDLDLRYIDRAGGAAQTFDITITAGALDKLGDKVESYREYLKFKMVQTGQDIIRANEDVQRKQAALDTALMRINKVLAIINYFDIQVKMMDQYFDSLTSK